MSDINGSAISFARANEVREMAAEAAWLATSAFDEEMRNSYLELQRQWNALANEIEFAIANVPVRGGRQTNGAVSPVADTVRTGSKRKPHRFESSGA